MSKIRTLITKIRIKFMSNEKYIEYLRTLGVQIGKNCNISKNANFGSEPWLIRIGNDVRITKGVEFITHDGGLWTLRKKGLISEEEVIYGAISVGDNCNISWNVIIMPGVNIGKNSIIGAGAVVTKTIPEGVIFAGVPARFIETIEEYYLKIKDNTVPLYSKNSIEKIEFLKKNKPELFQL